MKKTNKVLKALVVAFAAVAVIAAPTIAGIEECLGEGNKYPNLSTSQGDDYPVKCTTIKIDETYTTIYGKTSADCATAGTLTSNPDQCKGDDLDTTVRTIINTVIFVVGMIAVVMIIIGGINYAMSQGDPGKVTKAKNTIMYGIIGLVICLLAFAIVQFVLNALVQ